MARKQKPIISPCRRYKCIFDYHGPFDQGFYNSASFDYHQPSSFLLLVKKARHFKNNASFKIMIVLVTILANEKQRRFLCNEWIPYAHSSMLESTAFHWMMNAKRKRFSLVQAIRSIYLTFCFAISTFIVSFSSEVAQCS